MKLSLCLILFLTPFFNNKLNAQENERPLRIAIISDMNGDYGSPDYSIQVHKAVERLKILKPDAVLVTGDMASGEKKGLDYKGMWKGFRDAVTNPITESDLPMLVTPGNHDASGWKGYENERNIYKEEWQNYLTDYLSKNQTVRLISMENYPFYYSFAIKDVFFMSINFMYESFSTSKLRGKN